MQGRMKIEAAYAFIDAIRVGCDVSALGLGVTDQVKKDNSLYTIITVEGFCSALAFIVFLHEVVNLCINRYGSRVRDQPNAYDATEHTMYLFFRLASILASVVGLSLIASDLAAGDKGGIKAAVGTSLLGMGIFASRALSASRHKEIKRGREPDPEAALGERARLVPAR